MTSFAELLNYNRLTFNFGFKSELEPFFQEPPFSFTLGTLTFDPSDFNSNPIFATSNPGYTGGGLSGSGSGGGSGGGGGAGGASAFGVTSNFSGEPSAPGGWSVIQSWFAHGELYALSYNNNSSNTDSRPYTRKLLLYRYNPNTGDFENQNVDALLQQRAFGSITDLRSNSLVGINELSNGDIAVSYLSTNYPFGELAANVDDFFRVVTMIFQANGQLVIDYLDEADIIAQTGFTNVSVNSLSSPYFWNDLGGRPYLYILGQKANNNSKFEAATGSSGHVYYIDTTGTAFILTGAAFFADDEGTGNGSNGRFKISANSVLESAGTAVLNDRFSRFYFGVDDATSAFEYRSSAVDGNSAFRLSTGSANYRTIQSDDNSLLYNASGRIRDENFLNPLQTQMLFHRVSPDAVPTELYTLIPGEFSTNDSTRQVFSTNNRFHNASGDIIQFQGNKINYLIRGADFAVDIGQAVQESMGGTLQSRRTPASNTPYGFMWLTDDYIIFVQPNVA